jgi:S-(hydroxymethyl)glutathione dehydrogenase/alcohol dehydrogenase
MSIKARIAVLPPGDEQLRLETVALPNPGPFEVVIEQYATGVCHSQLDLIARPGRAEPIVLGHESMGRVVATGSQVSHVEAGDDVVVTWLPRSSDRPRAPNPARVALSDGSWAVTHNVFTWGTHTVTDEQYVVEAPAGTPRDLGSIIGCAVMTGAGAVVNRAQVRSGQSVAIWGVGGIGLAALAGARNVGASPLIAVDVADGKLRLARELGADEVVNGTIEDAVARVHELTTRAGGSTGVDFAFDCTGRPECVRQILGAVRPGVPGGEPGGTAVLVGAPRVPFELDGMDLLAKEKRLIGTYGGGCVPERDFPTFVEWHRSGRVALDALVTDRYRLEQVNDAVGDLRSGHVTGRAIIEL